MLSHKNPVPSGGYFFKCYIIPKTHLLGFKMKYKIMNLTTFLYCIDYCIRYLTKKKFVINCVKFIYNICRILIFYLIGFSSNNSKKCMFTFCVAEYARRNISFKMVFGVLVGYKWWTIRYKCKIGWILHIEKKKKLNPNLCLYVLYIT